MCVFFAHREPNSLCLFQKRFSCTASNFSCQLCCGRRINPAVGSFSALAVDRRACSSGGASLSTLHKNVQVAASNKWESVLCLHLIPPSLPPPPPPLRPPFFLSPLLLLSLRPPSSRSFTKPSRLLAVHGLNLQNIGPLPPTPPSGRLQ